MQSGNEMGWLLLGIVLWVVLMSVHISTLGIALIIVVSLAVTVASIVIMWKWDRKGLQ